jgi:DNA-binding transcriptional regulator GbsR (MarR family)
MDELPIRQFTSSQQKVVEKIVDKLSKIKEDNSGKSNSESDSSSLQSEIDSMVYDLYEVSEEFRQIIDSDMGV